MGDISRNLSAREFACKCGCGLNRPHPFAVVGIQNIADELNVRRGDVLIRSACRCESHNASVNGAANSLHLPDADSGLCPAVDVEFVGVNWRSVMEAAYRWHRFDQGGIGLYVTSRGTVFFHLDVREERARWGWVRGEYVSISAAIAEAGKTERNPT